MKKVISIMTASILALSMLAGCGASETESSSQAAPASSQAASSEAVSSEAAPAESSEAAAGDFDATMPITVVSREPGSGTRGAFIELFGIEVKGDDGSKTDMTTEEAVIASQTNVAMTNVANDPYAIGYISMGSLNDTVKGLQIDGVDATVENVNSGDYKAARPFMIATKEGVSADAQDFINFIMSAEGQQIIEDNGYIKVDSEAAAYEGTYTGAKIVIAGSSSVSPVMEKLIEAYKGIYADAQIELQTSDSTAGMTAAIDGTCDIGMASRALKDSEAAELNGIEIAKDGIVVIVAPTNPTENISSESVRAVFTGEVTTWDAVQ